MTTQEINKGRNPNGVFSTGNDVAGWFAISRDGIHMITFYEGKYTFSKNQDVHRFYTERGFAIRVTQLNNRGY
jgi:hypothetical protein